ncbi:Acetyl-CoA carboxylase [Thelohanellus kitauei]|uniref:Acetyl-CoA carboxylase n=1 Tax=Thelohanellus kitauei TaxID=669202 RepID=A0A0C2N1K9_THEKT|nr:Acetyl-CoA carboxylase [Thelohanellus kitauei]
MLPSGPSHLNYGNVELIAEIAQGASAQAVWPGWGHASENPRLPELLASLNILFLGPSAQSMWLLGDKIACNIIVQSLDIPLLPWNGSDVIIETVDNGKIKEISYETYQRCVIHHPDEIKRFVNSTGFPVIMKASNGGGGKGIRVLLQECDYDRIYKQIVSEVSDSHIFIVKMLKDAKHIEIQIIGDQYGNVISLASRDCSVQRRHQKVVEEGPATSCPNDLLLLMERDAVKLAKSVNYVGVGTVEYLYDTRNKKYHFLEFNPRLQVEHTCTELITNTNLPWCQLEVAAGKSLSEIEQLGAFLDRSEANSKNRVYGHVISTRIMAENAEEGFCPCQGVCTSLKFTGDKNVFGYFSIQSNGRVHQHTDSQFGHVFSWAPTREEARRNLVCALKQLCVNGSIRTITNFLICALEQDVFQKNETHTGWLDGSMNDACFIKGHSIGVTIACSACLLAHKRFTQIDNDNMVSLERGHVPKLDCFSNDISIDFIYLGCKYVLRVSRASPVSYFLSINKSTFFATFFPIGNNGLLVSVHDRLYSCFLYEEANQYVCEIDSKICILYKDIDPTLLLSPSCGKLLTTLVPDGTNLQRGDEYAEIEVMKMIMTLSVNSDGTIHFLKYPGSQVEKGDVIARLVLNDTQEYHKIKDFTGEIDFGREYSSELYDPPVISNIRSSSGSYEHTSGFFTKARNAYVDSYKCLMDIMEGYCIPSPHFMEKVKSDLDNVVYFLSQTHFTLLLLRSALDRSKVHFPEHIFQSISRFIYSYSVNMSSILYELPVNGIISIIETHAKVIEGLSQRETFLSNISDFLQTIQELKNGPKSYKLTKMLNLLRKYVKVEQHFSENNFEGSVRHLISNVTMTNNSESGFSANDVLKLIISHSRLYYKNILSLMVIDVISAITKHFVGPKGGVKEVMIQLSNFPSNYHLKVALKAKQFLASSTRPSIELRYNQLESIFLSIIGGSYDMSKKVLMDVIHNDGVIYDLLPSFFFSPNPQIHTIAIELYIRRAYISYDLICVQHDRFVETPLLKFHFRKKSTASKFNTESTSPNSSFDIFTVNGDPTSKSQLKTGLFVCFPSIESMTASFISSLEYVRSISLQPFNDESITEPEDTRDHSLKIVTVCVRITGSYMKMQEICSNTFQNFVRDKITELERLSVRQISFIVTNLSGEFPLYFTYCSKERYLENKLFRNIEPAEGHMLEVKKLSNYRLECIPRENPSIHIYRATRPSSDDTYNEERFFIRTIVRNIGLISVEPSFEYLVKASEIRLLEALDQLAIITSELSKGGKSNHLFFNFIPCIVINPYLAVDCVKVIVIRHHQRLEKQKITMAEMKMVVLLEEGGEPIPLRIMARNELGIDLKIDLYKEVQDPVTGKVVFSCFDENDHGSLSNQPVDTPYPLLMIQEHKRLHANSLGTTYVYDVPKLFEQSMNDKFVALFDPMFSGNPECKYQELIVQDSKSLKLVKIDREPALNTLGFVCWKFKISGLPHGLTIKFIVVASDITFMNGSFSLAEANLFAAASRMARYKKVPFVFICCCNGARIGMADEIKNIFKIKWNDDLDYSKGIHFLYLEEEDYNKLASKESVIVEELILNDRLYYKITDIIGEREGIGVENLHGSGLVASEMSKSYDEIFTISLVSSRAVGIGAYLVRLGRRVIQVEDSTIILTGAHTLNRVLAKNVYTSHEQLGGKDIMFANGVSQIVVKNDYEGVKRILKWLSFYFQKDIFKSLPPPGNLNTETTNHLKPRHLIYGFNKKDQTVQGFFDLNSVFEINTGWASAVITGRAKLGGIPVSFILNDIKMVKQVIPADPADPNDFPKECIHIGQVLSPDSSFKFSQHIDDSNRERLPLFIFANFRGFSAGLKDMYNQVLKFGSMIVDSLRNYRFPIFIYIMPYGELRGGSWAVLDSSINSKYIEMYACDTSCANILESSGLVSVKYREKEILKTMERTLKDHPQISNIKDSTSQSPKNDAINNLIKHFEKVAEHFASLHDTPMRMLCKKVIKKIVPWSDARGFFYWRLKRRLHEEMILEQLDCKNFPNINLNEILKPIYQQTRNNENYDDLNDRTFVEWVEDLVKDDFNVLVQEMQKLKNQKFIDNIYQMLSLQPHMAKEVLMMIEENFKT